MNTYRPSVMFAFRSPITVWAAGLSFLLLVPIAWDMLELPVTPAPWWGDGWQWLNFPWLVAALCGAAITWLHLTRLARRQSVANQIYSATYHTLPDAAGITSIKDGRFIDVNPAMCQILGMKAEEIIGRTNKELQVYASPEERAKLLKELELKGQVRSMRILCKLQNEIVPGTMSALPIVVDKQPCMLFVFHDMREHEKVLYDLHAANRQLVLAGQIARLGAWEDRKGSGLVYWSDVCYDIHGLPAGTPLPKNYIDTFVAPEHRERMRVQLQRCLSECSEWELEIQIIRQDGRKLWVRTCGGAVLDDEGKVIAMRGVMQDIDSHKRQEEATREREALLAITLEAAALGQWDWDLQTGMITGDYCWRNLNGVKHSVDQPSSMSGHQQQPVWLWTELLSNHDMLRCSDELKRHIQNPENGPFDFTWHMTPARGTPRWLRSIGKVVHFDAQGHATRMLGVCLDVTDQQEQKNNLQQLAHFDTLTGLANRVELATRLHEGLLFARQHSKLLGVVYLDLDGFKPVNDRLGHEAGDRLLVLVAKRLKHALREHDCIARFGGDEFVLLLTQLNSRAECESQLAALMQSLSQPYALEAGKEFVHITASLGYTLYPEDNNDADALIRHADQAMYQAKQSGRNRVCAFDSLQERTHREHLSKSMRIKEGLERGEFALFLQPKVEMQTKRVIGVEALARWLHPQRGILAPKDFLPHIEGSELEIPFGQWAIRSALQIIEQLQTQGLDIHVAANVSARHLQDPSFTQWVTDLLNAYPHIPAHLLDLEITESAALYDIRHVATVLQQLRALNVSISLDDFGTGYSSLTYLRNLPLDSLKIDRSFVRDMLTDQADMAIVHSVTDLARSFGYRVVAEGVESPEQSECLERIGCHVAQGYLFSQPMPLDELPIWIRAWQQRSGISSHALEANM